MRVLVADQESDMLEALARTFELDVATSKATCIDLLRANDFDVIVAGERLSDGSGLELLSQVGQRWPRVIRILSIEPERRTLLKGRLGPFKLFETIPWPIEEDKLEAVLMRAGEALARDGGAINTTVPLREALREEPRSPNRPMAYGASRPAPSPQGPTRSNRPSSPDGSRSNAGNRPGYPPLPAKGSKIVPLGAPDTTEFRILPHDYHEQHMPGTLHRRGEEKKEPTLQEKAAALAAEAMAAVVRYIKPQSSPRKPTKAPPRKKR